MTPAVLLQAAFIVLAPAGMLWLAQAARPARWLGPVVLCYASGILARNLSFGALSQEVSNAAAEAAVPLAIPLLLLPTDLRRFVGQARAAIPSFAFACAGSVLGGLFVGTTLAGHLPGVERVSGMLVGTYIGGTVNMNAIGLALNVPRDQLVGLNAADMVTGGLWLFFLLTFAAPLLRRILPRRAPGDLAPAVPEEASELAPAQEPPLWPGLVPSLAALGVAVAIVALAVGGTFAVFGGLEPVPVLLGLTVLGLCASLWRPLRALGAAPRVGEYAMLVFCVAIGSLVDVGNLLAGSPALIGVTAGVVLLAVAIHVGLARLFRVDADTLLITSTAAIYGPAFVPAVARAIGNRDLVAAGVTAGLLGFALGTWFGLGAVWLLTGG